MNRFLQSFMYAYHSEAGEEDLPGGGGEAKTYTQEEVDALTAGLKTNNEKLLSEKKEAARQAKEASEKRVQVEQDAAKQSGKLDDFEKTIRSQYDPVIAEKDTLLGKMSERILGSERKAIISALSVDLIDESAADVIGMMVRTEFNGDDVITKFIDANGNVITTDPAQFKKYLCEHKAFSHLVKSDAATGGGAGGNKKPNGGAGGIDPTLTGLDRSKAELKAKLEKKFK